VLVFRRHAEAVDGVALEVELDQHHGLFADHPPVMPRIDRDDLRRLVLDDAAVGVLDVDLAAREEPDVRVRACRGPCRRSASCPWTSGSRLGRSSA
jgi:hypothetical protein